MAWSAENATRAYLHTLKSVSWPNPRPQSPRTYSPLPFWQQANGNYNYNLPGLVRVVAGDALELISNEYKAADFVLVDCALRDQERVFRAAQVSAAEASGGLVVGLNAFDCEKFKGSGRLRVDLLPIGGGLRVCRVPKRERLRSRWVVRVDEFTGEEHVYRIAPPVQRKMIRA
ncbi:uncharacterized protein LOC109838444 [Asparagus officinalis]|uniref:uncharacterized protein LOC109838444 n=1 Tax=Asparagus officinalis TaxID=4686 RepID=UPI00098E717D|nr:uncharacterized protein LOC109838444 [Asparagus officinalis]